MGNRLTVRQVVKRFRKTHGNKCNYTEFVYLHSHIKGTILCPECGEFEQTARGHLIGTGCPKCKGWHKTTEEIIKQFRKVHGDKFDYSKFVYSGSHKKSIIICKIHGEFLQTANNHKLGKGCLKCRGIGKTTKEVIKELKKAHGDKYDYSKFEYIDYKTKGIIICEIHGEFLQSSTSHKSGKGCPKCSGMYRRTPEEAKKELLEIHNGKYSYPNFLEEYKNVSSMITVVCPIKGSFKQLYKSQQQGQAPCKNRIFPAEKK
jgi:hypothetical protein